jgi:mandelate racemase
MVASSVDTAMWDALAIAADMPLASFLGASPRQVPAYNSNGLGLMSPGAAADEAEALLENGFRAVKLRLGRGEIGLDLAAVRAVRERLPDEVRLMVDFNQALTFADAMHYCLTLDEVGVYWIEEPIRHDDYRHLALLAQAAKTPIQIGENFVHLLAATPGRHWLDWAVPSPGAIADRRRPGDRPQPRRQRYAMGRRGCRQFQARLKTRWERTVRS